MATKPTDKKPRSTKKVREESADRAMNPAPLPVKASGKVRVSKDTAAGQTLVANVDGTAKPLPKRPLGIRRTVKGVMPVPVEDQIAELTKRLAKAELRAEQEAKARLAAQAQITEANLGKLLAEGQAESIVDEVAWYRAFYDKVTDSWLGRRITRRVVEDMAANGYEGVRPTKNPLPVVGDSDARSTTR